MEQIEALLKRINAENKKTKEVLDNIQKGELNGNVKRKNSGINTLIIFFFLFIKDYQVKFLFVILKKSYNYIDPEESSEELLDDERTKNLATAIIPPIKTNIVEKTSTTFLDAYQITASIVPVPNSGTKICL